MKKKHPVPLHLCSNSQSTKQFDYRSSVDCSESDKDPNWCPLPSVINNDTDSGMLNYDTEEPVTDASDKVESSSNKTI